MNGTPREVFTKVDKVRALGLDVPPMTDLAHSLRAGRCGRARGCADRGRDGGGSMSIVIEHLNYVYMQGGPYETKALDDVSLTIHDGEFIGLIGHTGSGKSTLVQHLNGLILPTSGKITVDGMDLADKNTDRRAIRRRVGLVFQYPENQLFEETVAKDIAFGPKNLGLGEEEIDRRVRTAMRRVALDYDKLAQRSVFELSGGQMRRVAIAGVLAMEPQTLVLDEPCAGLDPEGPRGDFGADQRSAPRIRRDDRDGQPLDGRRGDAGRARHRYEPRQGRDGRRAARGVFPRGRAARHRAGCAAGRRAGAEAARKRALTCRKAFTRLKKSARRLRRSWGREAAMLNDITLGQYFRQLGDSSDGPADEADSDDSLHCGRVHRGESAGVRDCAGVSLHRCAHLASNFRIWRRASSRFDLSSSSRSF